MIIVELMMIVMMFNAVVMVDNDHQRSELGI